MSITKFNINADFIAYQHITAGRLSHLSGRAYKTEGGFFALCSKGSLKTIINHTEYRIGVNKLIVVPPETFVQLLAASDDVEIHAVMFSQQLIQNAGMGKTMMDKFHVIGKRRRAAGTSISTGFLSGWYMRNMPVSTKWRIMPGR